MKAINKPLNTLLARGLLMASLSKGTMICQTIISVAWTIQDFTKEIVLTASSLRERYSF
jgi:hypothetical protein